MVLLSGCAKEQSDSDNSSGVPQSDIVATVNGVVIDREDMYSEMEQYVPAQVQGFPQSPLLGMSAGRVALQRLITNELAVQLASLNQVPVTDAEVDSRYDDVKMVKESQSTKTFEDLLSDEGMTVDQFKKQNVKPDVAQYNIVGKGISVSDQELSSYYSQHLSDYTEPARLHIERIVLPDEASANQAYQTASKANSLDGVLSLNIASPLSNGDNAADIAEWVNVDQPSGVLKPVLELAVKANPGTVLPPVMVRDQWWLVRVVDRRPKDVIPFDKVKHIVEWNVVTSKANIAGNFQRMQSQMQDLTQQAVINVIPPQYVSLVKQLKNPPLFGSSPESQSQSAK